MRRSSFFAATFAVLSATVAPLAAQAPATATPTDSARPPHAAKALAVAPGALLPGHRIVAFYGNPKSTRMGILGELPPKQMLEKLAATAKTWQQADTTRPVRPALHLIVTVAQGAPGGDGKYRLRHSDAMIAEVASWAESRGWLLFLDVQVGRSTVADELPRLIPWLKKPWVHLALDPEFAMPAGQVPGKRIGTMDAKDVNYAMHLLANLVDSEKLPPKILVVHRFTEKMLTNHRAIATDPRVQVVIDADGFGAPALKKHIYSLVVERKPVQFSGLKLFFKNDRPMMTPAAVLALNPIPMYIQYQ